MNPILKALRKRIKHFFVGMYFCEYSIRIPCCLNCYQQAKKA